MKIGVVLSDLGARGGAERYTLNLLRRLLGLGHEVHVFTSRLPPELPNAVRPHVFRPRRRRLPRFLRHTAFERWLRAEVGGVSLDLLLTMEKMLPSDVFRAGGGVHKEWLAICRENAGPLKRLTMGLDPLHRRVLRGEAALFQPRHTRLVICNSHMVAAEIVRHYGYPRERIRVLHNGVDLSYFQPAPPDRRQALRAARGLASDEVALVFVGAGFWRKGLDIAIDIVAAWQRQEPERQLKLFVVGKGDTGEYRQQAERLDIAERVFFEGGKEPHEVLEWYQLADLFLFPTRYDPFANACIEAAACGLPVVTTTRNGFSEEIQPGRNGLALPPETDAAVWARACEELWQQRLDPETVRAAIAHLALDRHVEEFLGILDEAAQMSFER